jgi:glycogen debranching enzyme
LPEVFAGIERDAASVPARYIGANVPQAWASGALVHLVASLCGLSPGGDGLDVSPNVPEWMGCVRLRGLRIGGSRVDLEIGPRHVRRIGGDHVAVRGAVTSLS